MKRRTPPLPESRCWRCTNKLDDATSTDSPEAKPHAGAFSVCFYCAAISVFDDDLRLRRATDAEIDGLTSDEARELERARRVVVAMIRERLSVN